MFPHHLLRRRKHKKSISAENSFSLCKKWQVLSNLGKARSKPVAHALPVDQYPSATAEAESLVISGLVVTLKAQPDIRERAAAAINSHPAIHAGKMIDRWLPIAVEAADKAGCHAVHDWLQTLDGVDFVDVVAISFDEEEARTTTH